MGNEDSGPVESRPDPGRNITVIDLAPGNQDVNGEAGHRNEGIGLVGPMSNYAAPPQLVEDVPYQDLHDIKDFARRWREKHLGKCLPFPNSPGSACS